MTSGCREALLHAVGRDRQAEFPLVCSLQPLQNSSKIPLADWEYKCRGISRNWERGWWQGREVTRQRSQSRQGTGAEQWHKYKIDLVRCWENCLEDEHNEFLPVNPQIIPACMCISISRTCHPLLLLNQHNPFSA